MSSKSFPVGQALRRAKTHIKKGELDKARQLYLYVLERYPNNREAAEGVKALSGRMQQPRSEGHGQDQVNALISLCRQGRLQEALVKGQDLALRFPDVPIIANLLGNINFGLERVEQAIDCYNRALEIKPDYAEAYYNLGTVLMALGNIDEAVINYYRALDLNPGDAKIYTNLGNAFKAQGRYEEAVTNYRKALEINPDSLAAQNNLGAVFNSLGRDEEAAASYRRALEINPDSSVVYNNLGTTLSSLGKHGEAVANYRRALEIDSDYVEAYYNLGNALVDIGNIEEAVASYHKAVRLDESHLAARCAFLYQLGHVCDWDEIEKTAPGGVGRFEFGVASKEVAQPFTLLALVDDAMFHRRASEAYVCSEFRSSPVLGAIKSRDREGGRIKIGYFSADFYNHATMYLMAELFERHDRSRFEIHAFSFGPDVKDEMRDRLLNSVENFHDVRLRSNVEIAGLSRSLGIDVAVDLKGHTTHSRTGIFSYRAAPVQINYLGYPGTMGAPYFDYILADPTLIPAEYQAFYTEKVAYLPNSYQVNDSSRSISDKAMSRSDFCLPNEALVFCCFNNTRKITPDVFEIWMRLLTAVEGSVLWIFKANQLACLNLRKEALKRGVDPVRLVFAERVPLPEHLARHRLADLFLDTFNYNAHTTASDALWAGLPVLTKMGEGFASRVAGSLLSAVGLPELITRSAREYEDAALRLARNPEELAGLSKKLECNLKITPLFDTALFTRHIESAYIHMVQHAENGLKPEHFYVEN